MRPLLKENSGVSIVVARCFEFRKARQTMATATETAAVGTNARLGFGCFDVKHSSAFGVNAA